VALRIHLEKRRFRWLPTVASCLLFALLWPARAAELNRNLKPSTLNVGFTSSSFVNVNRNDAQAAFKVFLQKVGNKRGYLVNSQTRVFDADSEVEAAIKEGTIQLVIVDSWQYLSLDIHQQVTPFFVPVTQGKVGRKYLVLTRRDSGLKTLGDLRGKDLTQYEVATANVGRHWLDSLLLADHLGSQPAFFGARETVAKPTAAVLPVFFGKKPACFVDQPALDMITELNPQVGKELNPVVVSEPYVDFLVCLSNAGWDSEQHKADTIQGLSELHREPEGRQILTLFKIDQLVPFQDAQLDTVKRLWATHDQLQREVKQ
jgi:ABC-type phosphate/phosphonate transport system substrate-binding protein